MKLPNFQDETNGTFFFWRHLAACVSRFPQTCTNPTDVTWIMKQTKTTETNYPPGTNISHLRKKKHRKKAFKKGDMLVPRRVHHGPLDSRRLLIESWLTFLRYPNSCPLLSRFVLTEIRDTWYLIRSVITSLDKNMTQKGCKLANLYIYIYVIWPYAEKYYAINYTSFLSHEGTRFDWIMMSQRCGYPEHGVFVELEVEPTRLKKMLVKFDRFTR